MRRKARSPSTQLLLRLTPKPEVLPLAAEPSARLKALADLLLAALGPATEPTTTAEIREGGLHAVVLAQRPFLSAS